MELQQRAEGTLRDVLERYTAGEAAVVRAFFSKPRTSPDYLEMLLRQIGREVQVAHWLPGVARMGQQLERGVDRWTMYRTLAQIADELKHHALLADLAEWVAGRKLRAEDLRKYEVNNFWDEDIDDCYLHNPLLPEAARMVDVTRELLAAMPRELWQGVVRMSEGGGGAAFTEASRVAGDEFQRRFAAIMADIASDEMEHGPAYVKEFAREHVRTDEQMRQCAEAFTRFMAQHVRVRNEIYSYPLSEAELRSYDRPSGGAA